MIKFIKENILQIFIGIMLISSVIISMQKLNSEPKFEKGSYTTLYNNYLIFKNAAENIWKGNDLYIHYPNKHFDLYKYSPAFALFMSPFVLLPNWLGLILWNLLNALVLIIAVKKLPQLDSMQQLVILLICVLELNGSMIYVQSNGLMAGLMILTVTNLENRRPFWAAFFLMLSTYIKIFSLILGVFILFYKRKGAFFLSNLFWLIFLALIPIITNGFEYLKTMYISWWNLLNTDFEFSAGYSVMGILNTWFNFYPDKMYVTLFGVIVFLIPLFRYKKYNHLQFRMLYLANALIWVIIFNHKAESPTFVIAMVGVAIWYIYSHRKIGTHLLMLFTLFVVSLINVVPFEAKNVIIHDYFAKAFPCILVWIIISYKLIQGKILRVYNY